MGLSEIGLEFDRLFHRIDGFLCLSDFKERHCEIVIGQAEIALKSNGLLARLYGLRVLLKVVTHHAELAMRCGVSRVKLKCSGKRFGCLDEQAQFAEFDAEEVVCSRIVRFQKGNLTQCVGCLLVPTSTDVIEGFGLK